MSQPGGNPEELNKATSPPPAPPAPTEGDAKQASSSPSASEVDRLVDDNDPNRDLARLAYGYDPFKGSHLDSSRRPHNTRSQNRPQSGASASTSKPYPPMAVFPGQGSRGTGQPVSAMRTSEGEVDPDASHLTDETAAATAIALAATRDGQANMYGNPFGHGDEYDRYGQQQHQRETSARAEGGAEPAHSLSPGVAGQSAVGHDSMADSDASMSQGQIGGPSQGKRKKTFKYLQDEPPVDPSQPRAPHEKRKKVQKACRPCKR